MTERQNAAAELFANGYNCAQAVVGACSEDCGCPRETALALAGGFGGGLRCGEVCGAAAGGVMVVGLYCGQNAQDKAAAKAECRRRTKEFMDAFRARNGAVRCVDLKSAAPPALEGKAPGKEKGPAGNVCAELVRGAVALLEEMGMAGGPAGRGAGAANTPPAI